MKIPSSQQRRLLGTILVCAERALLAMLLADAKFFDGYAPFAVGMVAAAGPGWEGIAALVGAGSGALLLLDFPHALRTAACGVLLFTANNAFCELKSYREAYFLPTMTAGLTLAVEAVYAIRSGNAAEAAYCAEAVVLAAVFAYCARIVLTEKDARHEHPAASLVMLLGILAALSAPQFSNGFAPGRIVAVLAVLLLAFDRELAAALASATCIGLALDLAVPSGSFLHTACYSLGVLLASPLRRGSRIRAAGAFALGATLFSLPLNAGEGLALLYECLAGTLIFLLLPTRTLRAIREDDNSKEAREDHSLRTRLREAGEALRELYDSVAHAKPAPEENPAIVFDRAAEAVCRDCTLRERCWVNEYNRTYTALSDATPALLRNGEGRGADFPTYFCDRCIRFPSFLSAINTELRAFLLRRQYRARLDAARTQAAGQYAQLSELLAQTAEQSAMPAASGPAALLPYRVGLTLRPKDGEAVSGDSATVFETGTGELCLLLSDGMGSGESARRESAMAVRLIERFLRAGVGATPALQTLNGALNLRSEVSDSFTTVDLLMLSLKSGEGTIYKYGAAPSYIKRGRQVHRVRCTCLPAGIAGDGLPPETTHIRLESGSGFIMVTDGVTDATDDEWLKSMLEEWDGEDPQQLVAAILAESYDHKGTGDDAGVLAVFLPDEAAGHTKEI